MALVIYPVTGHWVWGFGWLAKDWNFWDFAGCSAVHSVGGWAALTGAIILGNNFVLVPNSFSHH
jgi:Amt family ammonium transporter